MKKLKTKPPSRIKYEENNPVVSFRISKEDHDNLEKIKAHTDLSLADIVKAAINKQIIDLDLAYWTGIEYTEKLWRVNYRCNVCGKVMTVETDKEKKAIVQYMNEYGWSHAECVNRKS